MKSANKAIIYILSVSAGVFGLLNAHASAASLSLIPQGQSFGIGQEFNVNLMLDTNDARINAAQAVINFKSNVLQFVSADRSKSVFNFWVEDPGASAGGVSFIGGTDEAISGKSLLIFTFRLKAIGAGSTDLTISDGIVTASDGKGTNVLSTVRGTSVTVSTSVSAPQISQEEPQRIVREPVAVSRLPIAPVVRVNLYPDQSKWYNYLGEVIALWDVPPDVVQVAAVIDQSPNTIPQVFDRELFNGKNFGQLKDGIWYLHVRFKNNVGNGPTAHYKLSVDTVPPVDFGITVTEGVSTDNPQPTINFKTNDALSGIDRYEIKVDDREAVMGEPSWFYYKLPLLAPGKHLVKVKALDRAGNVREKSVNLETLPIESPVITSFNKDIFIGEGDLLVRGTAKPDYIIRAVARKSSGDFIGEALATADKGGNWELVIDQPFKKGTYYLEAVAQDGRGALSLPVKSEQFKIREKPIFIVAGFGITKTWFFVGLIVILLGGFLSGWLFYHLWKAQLSRKAIVAQRDIVAMSENIKKDLDKALASYTDKQVNEQEAAEIEFLIKKVKDNLEKTQKYVTKNIEEIPE